MYEITETLKTLYVCLYHTDGPESIAAQDIILELYELEK